MSRKKYIWDFTKEEIRLLSSANRKADHDADCQSSWLFNQQMMILGAEEQGLEIVFDDSLGVVVKGANVDSFKVNPSTTGSFILDQKLISVDWIKTLSQDLISDAHNATKGGVIVFAETFNDRRRMYNKIGRTAGLSNKVDPIFPEQVSFDDKDVNLVFSFDEDSCCWYVNTGDGSKNLTSLILLFNKTLFVGQVAVTVSAKPQKIPQESVKAADRYLIIILEE
jgi:hypothetical protein